MKINWNDKNKDWRTVGSISMTVYALGMGLMIYRKSFYGTLGFAVLILITGWIFKLGFWSLKFHKKHTPCQYHFWRPATKEVIEGECRRDKPARFCDDCQAIDILTEEEFYAQFGANYQSLVWQHRDKIKV